MTEIHFKKYSTCFVRPSNFFEVFVRKERVKIAILPSLWKLDSITFQQGEREFVSVPKPL